MNRNILTSLLCATMVAAGGHAAAQDAWPSKPIRWIVPLAAGGPADGIARVMAKSMSEQLGQPVVVDNRPGAAGNIGHAEGARAKPDGYTLVYVMPALVLNPSLFKAAVDPLKVFDPVAQMTSQPYLLMARKGFPTTLPAIIDVARKDGAACGNGGGLPGLGCAMLKSLTKANFITTTFQGNGPSMNALLGGHVDIMIDLYNTARPQVEAGSVTPVAMTAARRGPPLPQLPTVAETLPGVTLVGWHGVMVPKGTPEPIVRRLNEAVHKALKDPEVRKYMEVSALDTVQGTPAEFGQIIADDLRKYTEISREAGIEKQ